MPAALLDYDTNYGRAPQGCAWSQLCSARGPWTGAARLSWLIRLLRSPGAAYDHILISVRCDHSSVSSFKGSVSRETNFSITHHFSQALLHWYLDVLHYSIPVWCRQLPFYSKYCPKLPVHSGKTSAIALRLWCNQWPPYPVKSILVFAVKISWQVSILLDLLVNPDTKQWRPEAVWLWLAGASSASTGLIRLSFVSWRTKPAQAWIWSGGLVMVTGAPWLLRSPADKCLLKGALSLQLPFLRHSRLNIDSVEGFQVT